MNLTNADFNKIEKALLLLPSGDDFLKLSEEEQNIIVNAETVMVKLYKKKRANNKRTAEYIAEKRKENKNYARGISHVDKGEESDTV